MHLYGGVSGHLGGDEGHQGQGLHLDTSVQTKIVSTLLHPKIPRLPPCQNSVFFTSKIIYYKIVGCEKTYFGRGVVSVSWDAI